MNKFVPYLIAFIVLFVAFSLNTWLGIAAIIGLLIFLIYNNRYAAITQKAMEESKRGNHQEALTLMEQALKSKPDLPAVQANYAYLLLKANQLEKADSILERIRARQDIDKIRNSVIMTHALVRWKQGRLDEAIEQLEKLHSQIKTTTLYGSLGYLYIEQGDLDRALEYNLEALDYTDTDAIIMDNLLVTYILREEWDKAEETVDKLKALNPHFPEANYHEGLVREHQGQLENALACYDEALSKPFSAVSTEDPETIKERRDSLLRSMGRNPEEHSESTSDLT